MAYQRVKRPHKRDTRPLGQQIELGLAVSAISLPPGQTRTLHELAAYCGCSKQTIKQIQTNAITKIRQALRRRGIISTNI